MKTMTPFLSALILLPTSLVATKTNAQTIETPFAINSDTLSFFEEPLATRIGPAVLSADIIIDQSFEHNTRSNDNLFNTIALGFFNAETQLPNSWFFTAQYNAFYERLGLPNGKDYDDEIIFSLSDEIGTFSIGNVSRKIFNLTHPPIAVGRADLNNAGLIGQLDETAGSFAINLNTITLAAAADQEGRVEAGVAFKRNIDKYGVLLSGHIRSGEGSENRDFISIGDDFVATNIDDTLGGSVLASITYASLIMQGEIGTEKVDINTEDETNTFAHAGIQFKMQRHTFSLEGAISELDDTELHAIAFGTQHDIARGLSFNTGTNYTRTGNTDQVQLVTSVRYTF